MQHRIKTAVVTGTTLIMLACSAATASVTTEGFFLEATCYVMGKSILDSAGTSSYVFQSFDDSGLVDRTADGPGTTSFGYRLDFFTPDQTAGRIRASATVADSRWTETSMIGSGSVTFWQFRTGEECLLELQGLHQWSGDSIRLQRTTIDLTGPNGQVFELNTSDSRSEINEAIGLPPGTWTLRVFTALSGSAVENGSGFAASSSLDLEFRIIPAPVTLTPLVALGLAISRRRR